MVITGEHEIGEEYLSKREFTAAIETFRGILKKDPHNFLALRGLMLASAYMGDIAEILQVEKTRSYSYNSDIVSEVIEAASEEDREYFTEFENIMSEKKRLYDINNVILNLQREITSIENDIKCKNKQIEQNYFKDTHPLALFIVSTSLVAGIAFFTVSSIVILKSIITLILLSPFIFWAIVGIFISVQSYQKMDNIKVLNMVINGLNADLERNAERMKDLDTEADKLLTDIKKSAIEFAKKDYTKVSGENIE
jgi:hypothetical protein